jgi:hypothetical protein
MSIMCPGGRHGNFQWNDNVISFLLDEDDQLDFFSATSQKEHVAHPDTLCSFRANQWVLVHINLAFLAIFSFLCSVLCHCVVCPSIYWVGIFKLFFQVYRIYACNYTVTNSNRKLNKKQLWKISYMSLSSILESLPCFQQ